MGRRLLVTVEVELRAGEVGGGVEAKGEFGVVQVVDQGRRLRQVRLASSVAPLAARAEREHGDRRRDERPVAERPGGAERSLGPLAHPLVVHAEEAIHRELDHERGGLGRARVGEAAHGAREAGVRLVVAAEEVLHAGTGRCETHPQCDRFRREELQALEQGGVPVGELPRCDQRPRAGEEQLDPHLGRRRAGQEPERLAKPRRGARWNAQGGGLPRLAQSGDGGRVALARRTFDVMRALRRGGTARGERLGASLVSAQSPTARRRLVDRPPDQRVPKAKAAGDVGLADEVESQQLVQRVERRGLGNRRGGRRKLGLERVAGHRSALQYEAGGIRQKGELLGQCAGDRGRDLEIGGRQVGGACGALGRERPGELLQVERVATALLVEMPHARFVDSLPEELRGLAARQSADLDADQCSLRAAPARARR